LRRHEVIVLGTSPVNILALLGCDTMWSYGHILIS
jgi:hypothetical protein